MALREVLGTYASPIGLGLGLLWAWSRRKYIYHSEISKRLALGVQLHAGTT